MRVVNGNCADLMQVQVINCHLKNDVFFKYSRCTFLVLLSVFIEIKKDHVIQLFDMFR